MKFWRISVSVLFISFTGLAYEITLTRIFSLGQWHNFAYMIISMAMLGFAGAGTVLAMISADGDQRRRLFQLFAGLTVPLIPVCFIVSQYIPFETYELTTQPVQLLYLTVLYLLLSVPFFTISAVIALSFQLVSDRIGAVYCSNLIGSGMGALFSALLLYLVSPPQLIYWLMVPAVLSFFLAFIRSPVSMMAWFALIVVLGSGVWITGIQDVRLSQYKPLSQVMRMPNSTILGRRYSPLSLVTAVQSPRIRQSPGQISGLPGSTGQPMPDQVGLYPDGSGPTVVNRADSPANLERFSYLNYVTGTLPFELRDYSSALILGSGGGTAVWKALYHGVDDVTAVEVDPSIHGFMTDELAEYSGELYRKGPVRPVLEDPRGYLESVRERFDLIEIPLSNAPGASGGGVYSLSENYLFTVEGFELIIQRLDEKGGFLTTQWTNSPPRSTLKVLATVSEAARNQGFTNVQDHLIAVRSWNTVSVLFSKSPINKADNRKIRHFLRDRSFDAVHYPGMDSAPNQDYIESGSYSLKKLVKRLLKAPSEFYKDYLFNVRPARDNHPYFNHFFKWDSLGPILDQLGTRSLIFVDWGYLVLIVTLLQAIPIALFVVGLPFLSTPIRKLSLGSLALTGTYFSLLGLGFMLLEIAFIQVFMQYLHYPVYSVAVVLSAFLVFSGIGSFLSERILETERSVLLSLALFMIVAVSVAYQFGLSPFFSATSGWSVTIRVMVTLGLLAPLTIPLGVPFPVGLRTVSGISDDLIPFAWAYNGASSVLGAIVGLMLAVQYGFRFVIVASLVLYILAGVLLVLYNR